MKIYKDPVTEQIIGSTSELPDVQKKSMLPPTDIQVERIKELKDRKEFTPHLDWLIDAIQKRGLLNTRGQAGILINEMKKKIREAGGEA